MAEESRQGRSIKIRPSILRKAHHNAIDSHRRLGEWIEDAIEEKIKRDEGIRSNEPENKRNPRGKSEPW